VADGSSYVCNHVGTLTLKPQNCSFKAGILKIENVYYAPQLNRNLLSSGRLVTDGYHVNVKDLNATIEDNSGNICGIFTYQNNLLLGDFQPY
jgi:hypothetical protein